MSFKKYNFRTFINKTIDDLGFVQATKIQNDVISRILNNENLIGKSETGSGKTHAFLFPLMQKIDFNKAEVQAIIVSPTRELAFQLYNEAMKFTKNANELDIKLFVGGSDRSQEIGRLEKTQAHIVIGTLGKLKDLAVNLNLLKLHTAKMIVFDEADMIFDQNEIVELDSFINILNEKIQILAFTATLTPAVNNFINRYLGGIQVIDSSVALAKEGIEHYFLPSKNKNKLELLQNLLGTFSPYIALIFANTKQTVDEVAMYLASNGFKVLKVTGDLEARQRRQVLKRLKSGEYQYVVASDIAARGLDISGVSHIINYELPKDIEFYIHRTGRTARHLNTGSAISLYDFEDNLYLEKLEKKGLKCLYINLKDNNIIPYRGPNYWHKKPRKVTQIEESIHKSIPVSKVVKPGHRKKRLEKINKELQKHKRAHIDSLYKERNKKK